MTFQDQRAASMAAQGLTQGIINFLNRLGVPPAASSFLVRSQVPFVKTPSNILDELAQYLSPVYAGIHILSGIKNNDARYASEATAKMVIGGSATYVASMLIANGLASGSGLDDDEKRMRSIMYDTLPPNSINISGVKRWLNGEDSQYKPGDHVASYRSIGLLGQIIGATAAAQTPEQSQEIAKDPFSSMKALRRLVGSNHGPGLPAGAERTHHGANRGRPQQKRQGYRQMDGKHMESCYSSTTAQPAFSVPQSRA